MADVNNQADATNQETTTAPAVVPVVSPAAPAAKPAAVAQPQPGANPTGQVGALGTLQPAPAKTMQDAAQAAQEFKAKRDAEAAQMQAKASQQAPVPTKEELNVTPKDATMFFPLMMTMAALMGTKQAGGMADVMNNMNAVMTAQLAGNKEFADHHENQMWEQYDALAAQQKDYREAVKPLIQAKLSGSPESASALRLELFKQGYSADQVDELLRSDKNLIEHVTGAEKAEAGIAKARAESEMRVNAAKEIARYKAGVEQASGSPLDKKTVDFYASQSLNGDNSWQVGLARGKVGQKLISAVKDRIPQMAEEKGMTSGDASANKPIRDSISKALADRMKYVAASTQFIDNFNKQSSLVEKYLAPGVGGAEPVFNKWIQAGRKAILGDEAVTAFDTAIRGLAREHQRIVTGVTSNGQLLNSAAETADELLNKSQTEGQIRANLKEMHEEANNANDAGRTEVSLLQEQLKHIGSAAAPSNKKTVIKTGVHDGKKVAQYSDGSIEYVN